MANYDFRRGTTSEHEVQIEADQFLDDSELPFLLQSEKNFFASFVKRGAKKSDNIGVTCNCSKELNDTLAATSDFLLHLKVSSRYVDELEIL